MCHPGYGISVSLTRTGSDFKFKVVLLPTGSRAVCLGVTHHLGPKTRFLVRSVAVLLMCGALSGEKTSPSFTISVGHRQ
jgi:hypothetical protein